MLVCEFVHVGAYLHVGVCVGFDVSINACVHWYDHAC